MLVTQVIPLNTPRDGGTKPKLQRLRTVYAIDESDLQQPTYVPLSHIQPILHDSLWIPDSPTDQPSLTSAASTYSTNATSVTISSPVEAYNPDAFSCSFSMASHERFDTNADSWFTDFQAGTEATDNFSDECPDSDTLHAVDDMPIFSADGSSRPFSALYKPEQGATHPRQLIIFVRHFYCGACQAYLSALAEGIPMRDYFAIPTPTNIIVIGCGAPDLIPHYKRFSNCPFPIFADPSRSLFKRLGMVATTKIGKSRPEYMADISNAAWVKGQVTTIRNSLRDPQGIRKRDILRGGNPMQIGGEFLFEDGQVIWCHRMQNYRDHTEVKDIRRLLELDDH